MTTATRIAFTWTAPSSNGGTPVIDYRVYSDLGNAAATNFVILDSNIVALTYVTVNVQLGVTYRFKVAARNAQGYSDLSSSVTILAA